MASIGIDFGTTYCTVAVCEDGKAKIVPNDQDKTRTLSYVAFTDEERLYGDAANYQLFANMENTIYGIKHLLGRCYNDPLVLADKKKWSFNIVDDNNKPLIPVMYRKRKRMLTAEQICAMILSQAKSTAEKFLSEEIVDAVITVPSNFYDAQRTAVKDAAFIAGLNVKAIVNEATAAAITFGTNWKAKSTCNVLVFDLGGGCFDVSIVAVKDCVFKILSTGGDTHFGGNNFEDRMVEYFLQEFYKQHEIDMSHDKKALNRLRAACEKAKRTLSATENASVRVDGFSGVIDFVGTISRTDFESINEDQFLKVINLVKSVIKDAGLSETEIDEIVLVGGSSRIPKIREILSQLFNGKALNKTINPDEAVAYGAAVMCGNSKGLSVSDITPHSIGLKLPTKLSDMACGLPRYSTVPETKWINLRCIPKGNHAKGVLQLEVFEGESMWVKENIHTCSIRAELFHGEFELRFRVDHNGILTLHVFQKNHEGKVTYINRNGRLKGDELKKMAADHKSFQIFDDKWKEQSEARNSLENFTYGVKQATRDRKYRNKWKEDDKNALLNKCDEILAWVQDNWNAELSESKIKREQLEKEWIAVLIYLDPEKAQQLQQREKEKKVVMEKRKAIQGHIEVFDAITEDSSYNKNSDWWNWSVQKVRKIKYWLFNKENTTLEEAKQMAEEAESAVDVFFKEQQEQKAKLEKEKSIYDSELRECTCVVQSVREIIESVEYTNKFQGPDKENILKSLCVLENAVAKKESLENLKWKKNNLDKIWTPIWTKFLEDVKIEKQEASRDLLDKKLKELTIENSDLLRFLSFEEKNEVHQMTQFAAAPDHKLEEFEERQIRLSELWNLIHSRKQKNEAHLKQQTPIGQMDCQTARKTSTNAADVSENKTESKRKVSTSPQKHGNFQEHEYGDRNCHIADTPTYMTFGDSVAKKSGNSLYPRQKLKPNEARESLLKFLNELRRLLSDTNYKYKLTSAEEGKIRNECKNIGTWCAGNEAADENEFRQREQQIRNLWIDICKQLNKRQQAVEEGTSKNLTHMQSSYAHENVTPGKKTASPSRPLQQKTGEYENKNGSSKQELESIYRKTVYYLADGGRYRSYLETRQQKRVDKVCQEVEKVLRKQASTRKEHADKLAQLRKIVDPIFKKLKIA